MKKLISLILALVLCFSLSATAFAAAVTTPEAPVLTEAGEEPTREEETMWYTRVTEDGLIQIRLWSITYGYWKTDWITVGHT